MTAPSISVVVPTYRRRASVVRLLKSLCRQQFDPADFEVIISIDGSEDGTLEAVSGFQAPFSLRAVIHPNRGRASACNSGISEAQGKLLVILDDDMEPAPGFLAAHSRAHAGDESSLGVLGAVPVLSRPNDPPVVRYVAGKFNSHLEKLARPGYSLALRDFYTGNFSIRRETLVGVGGFDEEFRIYGNEDLELSLRLTSAGARFVYCPQALAYQHYTKDFAALAQDNVAKGRTAVLLARKHPEAWQYLRLSTYNSHSLQWRAVRSVALAAGRVWPTTSNAVIALVEWAAKHQRARSGLLYEMALDYFFWLGARAELGDAGRISATRRAPERSLR